MPLFRFFWAYAKNGYLQLSVLRQEKNEREHKHNLIVEPIGLHSKNLTGEELKGIQNEAYLLKMFE